MLSQLLNQKELDEIVVRLYHAEKVLLGSDPDTDEQYNLKQSAGYALQEARYALGAVELALKKVRL
jgi:hypothetical protein